MKKLRHGINGKADDDIKYLTNKILLHNILINIQF